MERLKSLLFPVILLIIIVAGIFRLSNLSGPERTFKEAAQNRETYWKEGRSAAWYSGGVVVYVPPENNGHFVATYQPFPTDLTENDVIVVREQSPVKVGDVIRAKAEMYGTKAKDKDGRNYAIYYLADYSDHGSFEIVRHIDQNDPDFAKLVRQVSDNADGKNGGSALALVWYFYLNPASPLNPFGMTSPNRFFFK